MTSVTSNWFSTAETATTSGKSQFPENRIVHPLADLTRFQEPTHPGGSFSSENPPNAK
jgi:hypothetical protein